jgi:hypothetical protein
MSIGRSLSHRAELGFIAGTVSGPEIEAEPLLEYEVVIVGQPAVVPVRPSRAINGPSPGRTERARCAPIPDLPALAPEWGVRPIARHSAPGEIAVNSFKHAVASSTDACRGVGCRRVAKGAILKNHRLSRAWRTAWVSVSLPNSLMDNA